MKFVVPLICSLLISVVNLLSQEVKPGPAGIVCLTTQPITLTTLTTNSAWGNPHVSGVLIRMPWSAIEPAVGKFDFSIFRRAILLAQIHHKFVGLSVGAGSLTPAWVYAAGAQSFTFHAVNSDVTRTLPLPWDPVFMQSWSDLIEAFGQSFDHNPAVAYIVMSGPGRDYEMGYVDSPDDIAAFDALGGQALWTAAATVIGETFATAFPSTHLIYAMGPPTPDADGAASVQMVMQTLFDEYPQFGVACASLSPGTGPNIPSVQFIQSQSAAHDCGFQMFGPATIMAINEDSDPVTVLNLSLANATQYQAHYVEVYSTDCADRTQQLNLSSFNDPQGDPDPSYTPTAPDPLSDPDFLLPDSDSASN